MFFSRPQQNNIDLLRSIAIISVFITHAQHVFGGNFPFFGEYGGQFGPQLFFLISGYLIIASCVKYSLREYALHRIFRIFPAYWLYWGMVGILGGGLALSRVTAEPWGFLVNIAMLQQLFPSKLIYFDILHVTWTLTIEVLWYITAPLLPLFFKRISWQLVVGITVLSTLFVKMSVTGHLNWIYPQIASNPPWRVLFLDNSFLAQLCFFIYGGYIYFHEQALRRFNPLLLTLLFLTIFVLRPYYFSWFNPIFITGIGLSCLFVACLNSQLLQIRVIHYISEISYSVYLCHFPVLLWVHRSLELEGKKGVIVGIAVTLALSTLSYLFIERPGIKLGKRLAFREKPAPRIAQELELNTKAS